MLTADEIQEIQDNLERGYYHNREEFGDDSLESAEVVIEKLLETVEELQES